MKPWLLRKSICIIVAILVAAPLLSQTAVWKADVSAASVKFTTSAPFGKVTGSLTGLQIYLSFDESNPGSGSISASVDPKTVDTGISLRNTHLREKEEFFNTSKYPLIAFKSLVIKKGASGYVADGNLTIKAVTRYISIPFTCTKTDKKAVFKGQFTIDANDYNVGKGARPVTVYFEIPASQ
jgi:polyisoprenoid-binding protein YceI